MIIRSNKQAIQEYIESSAINQSKLKLLSISAQAFQEVREPDLFFEEKEHFLIGKAVDDVITMGENYWNDNYYISNITKPSDTIMSIVQQIFQSRISDSLFENDLLSAIEAHNYQPNWKVDTKIAKVSTEGEVYWHELVQSEGKTILDKDQYMKCVSIVNQLQEHRFTRDYFIADAKYNHDIHYQVPIHFYVDEVECKALLDMVIVDHLYKIIIPIDIKTMGDYTKFFDYQALRRRYDIQASWYMKALQQWKKDNNMEDYSIHEFRFIVASTTKQCDPLIYLCSQEFINAGEFGSSRLRAIKVSNTTYESELYSYGWRKLIYIYKWHQENGWDKDYEIEMNNGIFTIGSDYQKY